MSDIRVGDELRFTGKVTLTACDGAYINWHGHPAGANHTFVYETVLEAAERLPRKLAVGDRVLRNGTDIGTLKLLGRKYPDAVVEWSDGTLGVYVLSDLRLADPRTDRIGDHP